MASGKGLIIPILSKYDNKGLKEAQSAFGAFEKNLSSLKKGAAGVVAALGIDKLIEFGTAAVNAARTEQLEMTRLATSMKNIGAGFAVPEMEKFVKNLERSTSVADDQLRPALATLVNSTKDYSQAQKLLSLATDISAGSGKDLDTVVAALGKAYNGNTTALGKLGVGIDKATLKTGDFNKIVGMLSTQFAGQAEAAGNTMAGAFAKVDNAVNNAKESIGFGLMQAISEIATGGTNNVSTFTDTIEKAGEKIGSAMVGAGYYIRQISEAFNDINLPGWVKALFDPNNSLAGWIFNKLIKKGEELKQTYFSAGEVAGKEMERMQYDAFIADNKERKRREDALAAQKKLKKATQERLSVEQQIAQALAGKAGLVLTKDIQAVELYAASQLKFAQNTELTKQYMDAQNISLADAQAQMAALRDKGYDVAGIYALIATNALNAAEATKKVSDNLATVNTPTQAAVTAPSTIPSPIMAAAPQAPQSYANIPEVGTNMAQIQTGGGLTGVFTQQQPVVNNNNITMNVDSTDAAQKVMDIINSKLRAGASFYNNLSN